MKKTIESQHTVADLIKLLKRLPNKDIVVSLEGCDCIGEWNGAISIVKGQVLLCRE
jgi:hypothetical protein